MERLRRLCRNVSMRKSATAVFNSSQQGVEIRKPIQRGSIIIIGLEGVSESVSKGKINEPKDGQDNHIRNFRVSSRSMRGAAKTRSGLQNSLSQHCSAGSLTYGGFSTGDICSTLRHSPSL